MHLLLVLQVNHDKLIFLLFFQFVFFVNSKKYYPKYSGWLTTGWGYRSNVKVHKSSSVQNYGSQFYMSSPKPLTYGADSWSKMFEMIVLLPNSQFTSQQSKECFVMYTEHT